MKSLQFFTRRMAMPMVSLLILGTVSCQYDDTEKLFKIFSLFEENSSAILR